MFNDGGDSPRLKRRLGQQKLDKWMVQRAPSDFGTKFSKTALKQLEKPVEKGGLYRGVKKGLGKFKNLIEASKDLGKALNTPKEEEQARRLIRKVDTYLGERDDDDEGDGDKITRDKRKFAREMRDEAIKLLQDRHDAKRDLEAQQKTTEAQQMSGTNGVFSPGGGTSEVHLIKDGQGGVAYAFKSMRGESTQSGLKPGGGALREALSSVMAQEIMAQTGLDFGFPKVSVTRMNVQMQGDNAPSLQGGALVEGLSGKPVPGEEGQAQKRMDITEEISARVKQRTKLKKDITTKESAQQDAQAEKAEVIRLNQEISALEDEEGKLEQQFAELTQMARELPPAELQKIALCFMVTANSDLKWENVMIERGPKGEVKARPFDGGAAFMTDESFKDQNDRNDGRGALSGATNLLTAPDGQPLDTANQPMDREMVKMILAINVDVLAQRLDSERGSLARSTGLDRTVLDDSGVLRSVGSIRIMQEILQDAPKELTLAQFNQLFVAESNRKLAPR